MGMLPAGTHTVRWDGRGDSGERVVPGVYSSRQDEIFPDGAQMSERFRTTAAYQRAFDRVPRVRAGDVVRHIRDDEKNPGWFFGIAADDIEGYFPSRWFEVDSSGASAKALRDYDATELTVEAGVPVHCICEESGWLLVQTEDGREGWIPASCVK